MPLAKWLLLLCVCVQTLRADDFGLIRVGQLWRYQKGVSEPDLSSPVRWHSVDFDDRAWLSGRAGFSTPTLYAETAVLPDYGAGYTTVYFRKSFLVANTNEIAELTLRIDYDDGFVAYLNGSEVARRGLPGISGEPVPVNSFAPYHGRGFTEEIPLTPFLSALQNGTNVLAVQLAGSGTGDFTMGFVPELLANVTRGPFLQNTTPDSTQIIWKTFGRAAGSIEFGTNQNAAQRFEIDLLETNHVATLSGLEENTQYQYRIANRFGDREVFSSWKEFRTFKRSGPVTFNVVGDTGWASVMQFQIADQLEKSTADLQMHVGDIAYNAFSHRNSDFRCFSVYPNQMSRMPWFIALGNHEMYADKTSALESFYLPTNSATGTEHFYSFDHGDVHFVVAWADLYSGSDYKPGSPEYAWLDADLARTTKPWKFLFFHEAWRSSSAHLSDDYDYNSVPDSIQLDAAFGDLARRHGVQIIFNGHDHCYERMAPGGGPISFVTGGGGAQLYGMVRRHPDSSQFFIRNHFLRVTVENDEARVEAVGADGVAFDKLHIRRNFPARQSYASTWHSPFIETDLPTDPYSNVPGQLFDFQGPVAAARPGLWTSAGRLFVNNDREHLYLGLDEIMLRAGQELFLFIEAPGIPGVNSLAQLGDGLAHPLGEGADGLDFLSNLSFENFNPGIGVILGDEWGDSASRGFLRAGQSFGTGQGAFYLSNGIPLVPGQRLTQFNRNPQDFSAGNEQNSDLVELAIPYAALGGLRPGDTIRVGAIVGLAFIDTNQTAQSRSIDSGGIGYSVRLEGATTFLEGIEVRLANDPDPDGDGLTSAEELQHGTDPNDPDSDNDGMLDGWEVRYGFNPLSAAGNESNLDPDGDGLPNSGESSAGTDPFRADSDNDTLPDGWEVAHGLNPLRAVATDGAGGDPDGDGLANATEYRAGTDPRDASSRLGLRAIAVSQNSLRLEWSSIAGKRYKIQFRDSFAEPFQDVADPALPITASGILESFHLNFSPDLPPRTRYYRVQLVE